MADDFSYMSLALEQAKIAYANNEVPIGAVIVKNNTVISKAYNNPISSHDPTAHAEVNCLRLAGQTLSNYRLLDCSLYVTLEPCAMCVAAIVHARLKRLIFSATSPKTGCVISVQQLDQQEHYNHKIQVEHGVLAQESRALLKDFFQHKR